MHTRGGMSNAHGDGGGDGRMGTSFSSGLPTRCLGGVSATRWSLMVAAGLVLFLTWSFVVLPNHPALCGDAAWQDIYRRIGEASNPGPAPPVAPVPDHGAAARHGRELLRVDHPGGAAVKYPQPYRDGFDDIFLPGHQAPMRAVPPGDPFALEIESFNGTGWRQLKKRLTATKAHALLAQETWLPQAAIAPASRWAARHGWKAVWAPAGVGARGGASGGVAIFARNWLGLAYPPVGSYVWHPARAAAAVLEAPGHRPMLLVSLYLHHGVGTGRRNLEILADVGRACARQGPDWPLVVAADANMGAEDLARSGFDRKISSTILCPESARGTFRTTTTATTIDMFLVSDGLSAAVDTVDVVEEAPCKGHRPIRLRFVPRVTALKALHLRPPPVLARERVLGPLPQPPNWAKAAAAAEAAHATAARALASSRGTVDLGAADFDQLLEKAYAMWANLAEEELGDFAGAHVAKPGERAKRPNLVWRPIVPERIPNAGEPAPEAAVVTWLKGIGTETLRIAKVFTAMRSGRATWLDDDVRRVDACTDPLDDAAASGPMDVDDTLIADDSGPIEYDIRDFDDEAGDTEATWTEEVEWECRTRKPPTSWAGCTTVLRDLAVSIIDDVPGGTVHRGAVEFHDVLVRILGRMRRLVDEVDADADAGRPSTLDDNWALILADLITLRDGLDAASTRLDQAECKEESDAWKAWLREGVASGAANAHAYTRTPTEHVLQSTVDAAGCLSCAPVALLEEQRTKYAEHWRPARGPFQYCWKGGTALPRMAAATIREAALSFPWRTASTYDGLHPRQLANLSDAALEVLATLLQIAELTGSWPPQVSLVVTVMLPKPSGGFRPIGLLPAIYRVWARARRGEADAWEAANQRPFFAAAAGNGPVDAMWRLTARQEAGVAEGLEAAMVGEDLAAFYEGLDRGRLVDEATAVGFPLALVRAALGAYSMARMLTLQGRFAQELHATRGIVAGCSLATTLVKVYYLRDLDRVVSRVPASINLDVFIDDVTLSAVGKTAEIVGDMLAAHAILAETVVESLGCSFAPGKTAVVATSRSTTAALARGLDIDGGVARHACMLGVDNTAGAKRRVMGPTSRKAKRLKRALARRVRLAKVAKVIGRRAITVYRAGVEPAAAFDSPVWGVSDSEALRLRRLAAASMTPHARGRSLTLLHLWHDLPTATAELGPMVQYSRMVWKAVAAREEAAMRGTTLANLRALWESTNDRFAPLAEEMRLAGIGAEGPPKKLARRTWNAVRGPMSAAAATLARIGWRFDGPFELVTDQGATITLTLNTPTMVRALLKEGMRRSLERAMGVKWRESDATYVGRRVCADLAVHAVRPGGGMSRHHAAIFKSVACGAVMTMSRAVQLGYDVVNLCPLCGEEADTLFHRVYRCRCTSAAVQAAVPAWFWRETQRASAGNRFWTTACFPHPCDLIVGPSNRMETQVELKDVVDEALEADGGGGARVRDHPVRDGRDHDDAAAEPRRDADDDGSVMGFGGKIYVDGSCKPHVIRGLARATCAVVEATARGLARRVATAAVPRHLPQTPQAGEYLGMAVAFGLVQRPASIAGDCLNVVRDASRPLRQALGASRMYGGLVLSFARDPDRRRLVSSVRWTKAHRAEGQAVDDEDELDRRGNALADEAAKAALVDHAPWGVAATAEVEFHVRRAPLVARAVAAALELFPRAPGDMKRLPRPADESQAAARQLHHWVYAAGSWRCTRCNDWSTRRRLAPYRARQKCTGCTLVDEARGQAEDGHRLCQVEAELPFTFCSRCGAWGHRRAHKLRRPCTAPTAAGDQALKRIAQGVHPFQRKGRGGVGLPRERIRVVAAYDRDAGAWRRLEPASPADDVLHPLDLQMPTTATNMDVDLHAGDLDDRRGMPMDAMDEDDPFEADMDVFGHGGDLDEPSGGTGARAAAPAAVCPHPGGAHGGSCLSARRKRGPSEVISAQARTMAAVARAAEGSRPPAGNGRERLRAVRQRVAERETLRREAEGEDAEEIGHTTPQRDATTLTMGQRRVEAIAADRDGGDGASARADHPAPTAPSKSSSWAAAPCADVKSPSDILVNGDSSGDQQAASAVVAAAGAGGVLRGPADAPRVRPPWPDHRDNADLPIGISHDDHHTAGRHASAADPIRGQAQQRGGTARGPDSAGPLMDFNGDPCPSSDVSSGSRGDSCSRSGGVRGGSLLLVEQPVDDCEGALVRRELRHRPSPSAAAAAPGSKRKLDTVHRAELTEGHNASLCRAREVGRAADSRRTLIQTLAMQPQAAAAMDSSPRPISQSVDASMANLVQVYPSLDEDGREMYSAAAGPGVGPVASGGRRDFVRGRDRYLHRRMPRQPVGPRVDSTATVDPPEPAVRACEPRLYSAAVGSGPTASDAYADAQSASSCPSPPIRVVRRRIVGKQPRDAAASAAATPSPSAPCGRPPGSATT